MRLRFTKSFEHEVVLVDDKNNTTITKKAFIPGLVMKGIDILEDHGSTCDLQFEDNSCAFDIPKENFEDGILTVEQVENWRKVLFGIIGPYSLIMTREEIEAFRDKLEEESGKGVTC